MNSYRRGLRNGVLVNPKLFILEKFNLAPPTIGWSTWSNLLKTCIIWYGSLHTVSQVLREVQHEQFLRWLTQMRLDPTKRDNTRYCEFQRDHGHRTDDCIQLRKEIEYLIRHGYLRPFVASEGNSQAQPPPPWQTTTQHQQP